MCWSRVIEMSSASGLVAFNSSASGLPVTGTEPFIVLSLGALVAVACGTRSMRIGATEEVSSSGDRPVTCSGLEG